MAQFIHLTDERLLTRIERTGIKAGEVWNSAARYVFATPVLKDFIVSHQWVRELRRRGIRTIGAVQFRIPDEEPVKVGRFGEEPLNTTAVGAIRVFQEHISGLGLQVLIMRKILARELMRTYVPPQLVGWRYFPEAHGKKPCGCPACQLGRIKAQRLRKRYENEESS